MRIVFSLLTRSLIHLNWALITKLVVTVMVVPSNHLQPHPTYPMPIRN